MRIERTTLPKIVLFLLLTLALGCGSLDEDPWQEDGPQGDTVEDSRAQQAPDPETLQAGSVDTSEGSLEPIRPGIDDGAMMVQPARDRDPEPDTHPEQQVERKGSIPVPLPFDER